MVKLYKDYKKVKIKGKSDWIIDLFGDNIIGQLVKFSY